MPASISTRKKGSKTSKLSQQKLSPKKERAFRRAGDPKLQAKRRRTREDIEPDSIPLLSMSTTSDSESNNEEVGSKRSRLSLDGPPVVVPKAMPDPSQFNNVQISVQVDTNLEEYRKLDNAHDDKILVPVYSENVGYIFPEMLDWVEKYPGIRMTVLCDIGKMQTGYMRIESETVKPPVIAEGVTILYSVIEGQIVCKSSSVVFNGNVIPELNPVDLEFGSHITIPDGAMYTLENRGEEEASLYFVIIRQ